MEPLEHYYFTNDLVRYEDYGHPASSVGDKTFKMHLDGYNMLDY